MLPSQQSGLVSPKISLGLSSPSELLGLTNPRMVILPEWQPLESLSAKLSNNVAEFYVAEARRESGDARVRGVLKVESLVTAGESLFTVPVSLHPTAKVPVMTWFVEPSLGSPLEIFCSVQTTGEVLSTANINPSGTRKLIVLDGITWSVT